MKTYRIALTKDIRAKSQRAAKDIFLNTLRDLIIQVVTETLKPTPATINQDTMKLVRIKTGREVKIGSVIMDSDGIKSTIIDIDSDGNLEIEENRGGNTYGMCEPSYYGLKWVDKA